MPANHALFLPPTMPPPLITDAEFGQWCRQQRKKLKLTQTQVGNRIAYSQRMISDVECAAKPDLWQCKRSLREFYLKAGD